MLRGCKPAKLSAVRKEDGEMIQGPDEGGISTSTSC